MRKKDMVLSFIVVVLLVIVLLLFPGFKVPPNGTPKDYYKIIDSVNEHDSRIYLLGEEKILDSDLEFTSLHSISEIPKSYMGSFVIIDFNKYDSLSSYDIEIIKTLYKDNCTYFVLLNYGTNNQESLNDYIDSEDLKSDLLVLDYDVCGGTYYTRTVEGFSVENDDMYTYQIIHFIRNKLNDINDE